MMPAWVWVSVSKIASWWPRQPSVDESLREACERLGYPRGTALAATGEAVGLTVAVVGAVVVSRVGPVSLLPLALTLGVVPPIAARRGPIAAVEIAHTRALGKAPALFGRLTLRLRVEPSLERAVEFAGDSGESRLADSLQEHARRATGTPETGLASFASAWSDREPAVERAAALVGAAADAPADARNRGCERALAAVRTGVEERTAAFAGEIRAPLTGLYAFGVLLPLALIGVLPAARLAGLNIGIGALAILYNGLLPVGLLGASGWLLTKRPVAFPPPEVDRSDPTVPDRRLSALLLGVGSAAVAGTGCWLVLPWATPIAAIGAGTGIALLWLFTPAKNRRETILGVEAGLPDALTLVGRRVADGIAVERALAATAKELPGATGDLLTETTRRGEQLRLTVSETFFGRFGALRTVPSPQAADAGNLFTLAATEGKPTGDALVAAGDHLRELRRVEREARRELATVTGTLANTAVLFGPLVGGVTVAMVGGLPADAGGTLNGASTVPDTTATAKGSHGASALGTQTLGPVVGMYVLLLATILTGLATALEHGVDRSLLGYRIGLALPTATGAYIAAVVAAGAVL